MTNYLKTLLLALALVVALVTFLPGVGFSQEKVSIYDFYVFNWLKAVKLNWKAAAAEGAEGIFEVYRSDNEGGPYSLLQEIKLGDRQFVDPITGTYVFYDRKAQPDHSYYYKVALRGTNQSLGPLKGLARSGPPGT